MPNWLLNRSADSHAHFWVVQQYPLEDNRLYTLYYREDLMLCCKKKISQWVEKWNLLLLFCWDLFSSVSSWLRVCLNVSLWFLLFFHLQSYSLPYEINGACRDRSTEYKVKSFCCSKCKPGKMMRDVMMCLNAEMFWCLLGVLILIQELERREIVPARKIRCVCRVLMECTRRTWIITQTASHALDAMKVGIFL